MIPEDLIPYIADTYVNSRQIDLKASKQNDELFAMTARQLLSTLRLAQAHAKLYFREKVTADDVEEALRLVYMSKASVVEVEEVKGRPEDIMSSIFAIIPRVLRGEGEHDDSSGRNPAVRYTKGLF